MNGRRLLTTTNGAWLRLVTPSPPPSTSIDPRLDDAAGVPVASSAVGGVAPGKGTTSARTSLPDERRCTETKQHLCRLRLELPNQWLRGIGHDGEYDRRAIPSSPIGAFCKKLPARKRLVAPRTLAYSHLVSNALARVVASGY